MTIYIVLLVLIGLYGLVPYIKHNNRQSKKIFLFLSFFTMTLVIGLRSSSVGEDTQHYLNVFNYSASVKWISMFNSTGMRTAFYTDQFGFTDTIENGFLALAKIVRLFTNDGQVFLFIVAAITCWLFAKFIYDNCDKVVFPTYIFLCESMFMLSFNGIRQILAGAIVCQAYTLLKKNKWKSAIIVILIAALMHNVALVGFALFPIMLIKPKKEFHAFKYAIIMAVLSPFVIMAAQAVIVRVFPRYIAYFTTNFWQNSLGGTAVLWLVEFILILYMYIKKFKIEDSFTTSSLVLLYLSCELMGFQITMFSRVGWFFRPYLILFFPKCKNYFSNKNWRWIKTAIIVLLFFLYISYARTDSRNYSFFWQ